MNATVSLRPIAEAPVAYCDCPEDQRSGTCPHEFGPCILDLRNRWQIGYWNGKGWYDRQGDPVWPIRFGLLPPIEPHTAP